MVPGTKFSKKFFCYFCELSDPEPENTKKKFSSINVPPPPLAPRTKFSEKFFLCHFCGLGDSKPEN